MMKVTLPTSKTYYDLYAATGFTTGQSIVISNGTSTALQVIISATAPVDDTGCVIIPIGATYVFSP